MQHLRMKKCTDLPSHSHASRDEVTVLSKITTMMTEHVRQSTCACTLRTYVVLVLNFRNTTKNIHLPSFAVSWPDLFLLYAWQTSHLTKGCAFAFLPRTLAQVYSCPQDMRATSETCRLVGTLCVSNSCSCALGNPAWPT
jgi:hypothetical protein